MRVQKLFSTQAEKLSASQAAEKLLHARSDLRSERMMSVKCGCPGEAERLLFSSRT